MDTKLIPGWQWILLLLMLLGAGYATETLIQHEQRLSRSQLLRHEIASAGQLRALLESELNIPLYLTIGLTAYVQTRNGDILPAEMHMMLPELAHQARHIRNIGVAPGNTLKYIYPLTGNEQAINLYYPDITEQWPDIAAIIEQREARLVGPVQLIQGGSAFIYRVPVYLNANDYWGIISTVVDIDSVWALMARQAAEQQVKVAIRNVATNGQSSTAFYGDDSLFYDDSLQLDINLRGALWQMALRSDVLPPDHADFIRLCSYSITSVVLALLLWLFITLQSLRRSAAEQHHTRQYLRSIMDNVADVIITTDPEGLIEQVNMACKPMFGYLPQGLNGHHWSTLLAEPQRLEELYSATSVTGAEYSTTGRRRDDSEFPLAVSRSQLQLNQETKQLLVLRDLSSHHHNEQLKQEFIATVCHELRSPVSAMSGALGLVTSGAAGDLSAAQLRMLQLAKNNNRQILAMLDDIIEVERIASGTLTLHLEPVTLYPLLQQCVKDFHLLHPALQLQLQCESSLHVVVALVDAARLQQIVNHLLYNAARFSAANGEVIVSLNRHQEQLRIMVQDNGEGVPDQARPMLFRRFSQSSQPDGKLSNATGLGLSVGRSLISQMQGSMGYKPAPGQGSCFYIDLPYIASLQA